MANVSTPELYSKEGIELPTHTTPHNQVVVAQIPDPSPDVMDNYLALKNERELSWDQVAGLVAPQDPALAEYLRANGPGYESTGSKPVERVLVTEVAVNPLSTPEEREAVKNGEPLAGGPITPANSPDEKAPAKATARK